MSRTSLDFSSCHATNSAPWLFSDPYAYQYADIPSHIRQTSATRQETHNAKDSQALSVATTAVEAGSVPVFETEGCTPKTPAPLKIGILGVENMEVDSGLRFELGDNGTINAVGDNLARLRVTPSVTGKCLPESPSVAAVSPHQTPGCLQIGGGTHSPLVPSRDGEGIELYVAPAITNTLSSPATPTGSGGILRRSTANRAPGGGSRRSRGVTTMPSTAVAEARHVTSDGSLHDNGSPTIASPTSTTSTAERPAAASSPPQKTELLRLVPHLEANIACAVLRFGLDSE